MVGHSAKVFRVLACPTCGLHYSTDPEERRRMTCCGSPLPLEPLELIPGLLVFAPRPDQFDAADTPAIVPVIT